MKTLLYAILSFASFGLLHSEEPAKEKEFTLRSSNFENNGVIPISFACTPRGENLSPDLSWTNAPFGTQSLVLTVIDPDAPGNNFVHWIVYNIPPTETRLPSGMAKEEKNSKGMLQGINNHHHYGYDGPCPPAGKPHRYVFTLYALNTTLSLPAGARLNEVQKAIKNHVIGQAVLIGTFSSSK